MREIIKTTLEKWIIKLDRQEQQIDDIELYDYYLDHHLLGVAKFLKEISFALDDVELLGISTKLEMHLDKKFDEEAQDEEERMLEQDYEYEFIETVRALCIKHFYTEPAFTVDMSKYRAIIENSSANFSDPAKLSSLQKYINEKTALDKIYDVVKNNLAHSFMRQGKLPEFKDIESAFNLQLLEIYRRADAHVSKTLARYAST